MEQYIPTPNQTLRFIRVGEAVKKTGLSKSSIYDLMAQDLFPKTVRLGARSVAFIESEIDAWMVERITTRNTPSKQHQ
ncbi:helix-turn-helix transcriptional regulator [Aeromonas veronii]|jgi:prophage regulatory protein|uniref:helix-turn-helix transcriptional regulator n=1 Tax=Aeromonas veronii TaxID=654 RepID=UPI0009E1BABA|nr:AlpA family transcriptional regulator [Aeromonas veronii]MCX0428849.1 AlpA family transcriptional regulator [Aeromonas veronii]MCX0448686.1 AlpA family transcriptional regulator [Aeromonas veronii]POG19987.1 AlpA family transcriptional regulator [Aeromonas veronii]